MNQRKQPFKGKKAKKPLAANADPLAQAKIRNMLGIIIFAFAFLLYAQSISFNYALDDTPMIKENKLVVQGVKAIPEIIKKDYWHGYVQSERIPEYRPASLVMFAIERQLAPNNPHLGHFMNVLLYAITCWLLFLLLCKLFKNQSLLFPIVCALLYAAHPIHTEVVNNIKSRDEILCFLFFVMSAFFLFKYIEKKSPGSLIFMSISYFLSMFSKENGVTGLVILPLMVYFFTNVEFKKMFSPVLLLVVLTLVFLVIRSQVVAGIPNMDSKALLNNTYLVAPDFISREATAFYILLRYLVLLIIPHPLSYDYGYAELTVKTFSDLGALAGLIIYLALGIYAIVNIRKKSVAAFAILFYLISLAPASNVFLLIGLSLTMAERFMYMPSLGFCMLITFLLIKYTKTDLVKAKIASLKQLLSVNKSFTSIILIIICLYSIKTLARNPDWKDNTTLFGHDVEVATKSSPAHYHWGLALFNDLYPKAPDKEQADIILNKAEEEFLKSISITENNGEAYSNLGLIYERTKQFDKALAYSDSATKYVPDNMGTHANKGFVYSQIGKYDEAIAEFQKCIELNPEFVLAYKNLGICYLNLKQYTKTIEYTAKSLEMDPNDIKSYNVMAAAYEGIGDMGKAREYLEKAKQLSAQQ